MRISMQDPVEVAMSAPGETRWGFHQFPVLNRIPDGGVLLLYADAEDASETHGVPAPCHVSHDDGASWSAAAQGGLGGLRPTRPHFSISKVFDGEWLCIPAQPYLLCRLPRTVHAARWHGGEKGVHVATGLDGQWPLVPAAFHIGF